ncbi:hypothetical protein LINPERHAP2_LOCUS42271 [Linum perenne]
MVLVPRSRAHHSVGQEMESRDQHLPLLPWRGNHHTRGHPFPHMIEHERCSHRRRSLHFVFAR